MSDDDLNPEARPYPPSGDQPPYAQPSFGDPRGFDAYRDVPPAAPAPAGPRFAASSPPPPPEPPSWLPGDTVSGPSSGPTRRSRGKAAVAAGLAAVVVLAAGVGGAVGWSIGDDRSSTPAAIGTGPTVGAASQTISSASGTPKSYADIAAAVLPVVVSIDVRTSSEGDTGSGVIIESTGYILTNNHVVTAAAGGQGTITVHFNDGTSAAGKIVGTDLSSDLAVIKVARTGLPVAHLGSSAGVKVGDAVLAIGSPLGLSGTVTSGIVSALNRPVDTTADQQQQAPPSSNPFNPFGDQGGSGSGSGSSGGTGGSGSTGGTTTATATVFGAIQTDAAINPGNSGGALVDAAGNVIGINSAIASLGASTDSTQSGSIGVGFAIPIDLAKYVAGQLIKTGKASHAQIGVGVADSTDQTTGVTKVVVQNVSAGTPGAKAGLLKGDVITKINNTIATDEDTLIATIRSLRPGDQVTVTISRAGVSKTLTLTLGASSS